MRISQFQVGDTMVVASVEPIGLLATHALKIGGAGHIIIVSQCSGPRQVLALEFGSGTGAFHIDDRYNQPLRSLRRGS